MSGRHTLTLPVQATVGPVHLHLAPFEHFHIPPDDSEVRPWAWLALCWVTFHFGDLRTTKRLTQRYGFYDARGWAVENRPTEVALAGGRLAVLDNMRTLIGRHGIQVGELEIIETPEAPR